MKKDNYDILTDYITGNQDKFYRLAFTYVHQKEAALDIVQNAVVKALQSYESIRNISYIKTWFYRILVNESLSYLRKAQREYPMDLSSILETAYSGSDGSEKLEVFQIVNHLPEPGRTILFLHYYEGFTIKEISQIKEMKLSTVKYHLYASLEKLKEMIKEETA